MAHGRDAGERPARTNRRNLLLWVVALLFVLDVALGALVWQAQGARVQPHLHNAKVQVRHTIGDRDLAPRPNHQR